MADPQFADWYAATGCTGSARQGARALMRYALDTYDRAKNWGIYNCRETRSGGSYSPHAEGRAIDVAFPLAGDGTGSSYGHAFVNALLQGGPSKLGIQAIIYDRTIWSAKSPNGRPYTGASPHYDHVHVEMTRAAANSVTLATVRSVLDGVVVSGGSEYESFKQAEAGSRTVGMFKTKPRSAGTDVAKAQETLNAWYPKLSKLAVDGYFGPKTADRVRYLQRKAKLTVDGILGPKTWAVLLGKNVSKPLQGKTVDFSNLQMAARNAGRDGGDYSVEAVQRALNYEFRGQNLKVDGIFGRLTRSRYGQWQYRLGYRGGDADGIPGRTSLGKLADKYGFRVVS